VRRDELRELHYITPIVNIQSICTIGILSHNRAKHVNHTSCAMEEIQERRDLKTVPGGYPLHDYVNVYFHARNPMMFKRCTDHLNLAIIKISTDVLDIPGTVISDRNAASGYVRFAGSPDGLEIVDKDLTFARDWRAPGDRFEYYRRKLAKCAEILVPRSVATEFIRGFYVSAPASEQAVAGVLSNVRFRMPIMIDKDLFFQ
jgi:hypothetical protein